MNTQHDKEFDHSHQLARRILPFLGKRDIPITPENYMIFYYYFEGDSPSARRVVDEHLNSDSSWTHETTEIIYEQLFSSEASLAMLKNNEQVAINMQDMAKGIMLETGQTADATGLASDSLRNSLDDIREFKEIREVADWLQKTMTEVDMVTEVSRKLGDSLSEKGAKLGEIVESLNRMESLALTDDLTKLANRRAWNHRIKAEFDRFARYERPCSMVMMDLDDFKNINDKYGHLVGDQALMVVGRIMSTGLRSMDCSARFGGEEFTALLPETTLDGARQVAEKLRSNLGNTKFSVQGDNLRITASVGVSTFRKGDRGPLECLARADQAMYLAKSMGKNLVMDETELDE